MDDNKPWYASKGVWGSIMTLAAAGLTFAGYNLDPNLQGDIVAWGVGLGTAVGGALSLWGRVKASKKIGG